MTAFLSASLLFSVEPMFTKLVLPILGGSSAVWTCCILFFQVALLVGYFYADRAPRLLGAAHIPVHCVLVALSLLALPLSLTLPTRPSTAEHPVLWLLIVLTVSLGLPFVMLSSSGPLLQQWHSRGHFAPGQDSYGLYAASNAGSLLALLSYPVIVEPALQLSQQRLWWSVGYVVYFVVLLGCALLSQKSTAGRTRAAPATAGRVTPSERVLWIVLSLVPSSLFLALTTYLTTDIAPVPLLWILPLALYLLSFILVFVRRPPLAHAAMVRLQASLIVLLAVLIFWGSSVEVVQALPFHVVGFFVTAMVCHGELARRRPDASHLTEYYLWIAVGGALGGVFNVLVAPRIFNTVLEYPVMLVLAAALRPRMLPAVPRRPIQGLVFVVLVVGVLAAARLVLASPDMGGAPVSTPWLAVLAVAASLPAAVVVYRLANAPISFALGLAAVLVVGKALAGRGSELVFTRRNFFGVHQIRDDRASRIRYLLHGSTIHGAQALTDTADPEPLSYYSREGPVGDLFREVPSPPGRRVGLIGVGTGAMAAYAGPGEEWTGYEIDPLVVAIARNPRLFTFLSRSRTPVQIVLGDGRLSLAEAPNHRFDLLVLDAFNSDAIPVHLLTREAMRIYLAKLAPKGVLAVHLSNRYLRLDAVLGNLVADAGLVARLRRAVPTAKEAGEAKSPSMWAVVARSEADFGRLAEDGQWQNLSTNPNAGVWTDDYSDIFRVLSIQ
ncbi:MAG: fused MFS/spermidine synthase [Gemmatimonadales bacterium]